MRLRALWETRERLGRDTDTAPARIAGDKVLLDLAAAPPTAVSELGRRGVRRQAVRRFGKDLLAAVHHAEAATDGSDDCLRQGGRAPREEDRALADRLRVLRAERARALGIDAGVLCPGRTLMAAVVADPKTPKALRDALGLRNWQWQQLGDAFCDALDLHGPGRPAPVTTEGEPDDG